MRHGAPATWLYAASFSIASAFCMPRIAWSADQGSPRTRSVKTSSASLRAMAPPEINMRDIYASIFPFVLVMVLALTLNMIFPQIALWLPHYVYF